MSIIVSTIFQGLLYAVLAIGVYVAFRVLNFADMTAEGSFTLGGSVCAVMISCGIHPVISLMAAALVGCVAGMVTGILNTKFKIQDILSGILVMIALYSVNIRVMGKSNVSILGKATIFKFIGSSNVSDVILGLLIFVGVLLAVVLFFKTQLGLAIRATGDNESMAVSLGVSTSACKIIALMISGLLCALSGALVVQDQGYSDIGMGIGVIVVALASIIIGETLVKRDKLFLKLIGVGLGAICYKFIVFFVLSLGMSPSDLKLFTAGVTVLLLAVSKRRFLFKRGRTDNA